jgi:hypothetical protein
MSRATRIADVVVGIPYGDQGRKRWIKVGALLQHADNDPSKGPGFSIVLDATFNPAGAPSREGQIMLSCFHPDDHPSRASRPAPADNYKAPARPAMSQDAFADMNDDIPF